MAAPVGLAEAAEPEAAVVPLALAPVPEAAGELLWAPDAAAPVALGA